MERLITVLNWTKPHRAQSLLNTLLYASLQEQKKNNTEATDSFDQHTPPNAARPQSHSAEFAYALTLKTTTASYHANDCGDQIICDARIDNRAEILAGMNQAPNDRRYASVGEIILAAYRQWGEGVASKLVGDFSFVIWDAAAKKVFAARDPMNMRMLYYARIKDAFCIASDIEILLKNPDYKAKLNKTTLAGWIGGSPAPDASLFEGIECLPAGNCITAFANAHTVTKFWDLDPAAELRYSSIDQYEDHLQSILTQCVNDRLSDGGNVIASQMSGGMDSTSVTALAHKTLQSKGRSVMVISHSYADTKSCDETEAIQETLDYVGLDNAHWLSAEQHLKLDFSTLYPPTLESPGTVLSPRYIDEMKLMQKQGAKVLLTGSGGDEMCWGHSLTYGERLKHGDFAVVPEVIRGCKELELPIGNTLLNLFVKPMIPAPTKKTINGLLRRNQAPEFSTWIQGTRSQALLSATPDTSINAKPASAKFKNPALHARYEALRNTSTLNSVRSYRQVGAQYGIDVRHPFFDRRLAEFSFAIPDDLWIRDSRPKWLLRRAMNKHLPDSVCWNKKKIIFDSFFGNMLKAQADVIREILSDTRLEEMGLVNNERLLAAFEESIAGPRASLNVDLLYALLSQVWFQKYAHHFGY